jgi:membrane associated rhomboid family serine protease
MANKDRLPGLTIGLILVNLAMAVLSSFDPTLLDKWGFLASKPDLLRAVTCLFLHANVFHLLGNLVFLAAAGPVVEFALGRFRFLVVYLVGGLMGVLGHYLLARQLAFAPPLIGASGAIAACVGFAGLRFLSYRVAVLPNRSVSLAFVALTWLALQAFGALVRLGEESTGGAAFGAHIGGFIGGVLLGLVFRAPKQASLSLGHEVLDKMNQRGPAAALAAAERVLADHPDDARALRQRADALRDLHEPQQESAALLEWFDRMVEQDRLEVVQRLEAVHALNRISPMRRIKMAHALQTDDPATARHLLLSLVKEDDDATYKPDALLALAELTAKENVEESQGYLQELADKYAFHGAAEVAKRKGLLP